MDATLFDKRGYPVVSAREGYAEWAGHYEDTVAVGLDVPLLEAIDTIAWARIGAAADLACGTGRTGTWLAARGVGAIDGIDLTPEMLALARGKNVYRRLELGEVSATPFPTAQYDLCTMALADEHLAELGPVYREVARLLAPGGRFLLVGYHPFFLMSATTTHYHRPGGEAVAIRSYVHLFSDHHRAGAAAGLALAEFKECVIDEAWLATKPKWWKYLHWPVSFALVWHRAA